MAQILLFIEVAGRNSCRLKERAPGLIHLPMADLSPLDFSFAYV